MTESKQRSQIDLLIVDDDDQLRGGLAEYFRVQGYPVQEAETGEAAVPLLEQRAFRVAILDMAMPGMSGIELLQKLKTESAETECILLTGEGTIERAVEAMKLGAFDFLTKPVRMKQLEAVILKAAETSQLRRENRQLREVIQRSAPHDEIVGSSSPMLEVFRLIGEGMTSSAIADKLGLSIHTIDTYREKIKHKIGVKNSVELQREAVRWTMENEYP